MKNEYVVVWTASRPWLVAMGRLVKIDRKAKVITLAEARCVIYYDADTRGVLGAASRGPGPTSRVSPPCDDIELSYEGFAKCSPEARKRWEAEPWR